MVGRKDLIKKYLDFFVSKGHKIIPNKSLIPENDPTVLFTTAGMHPLVPFLLGQSHPSGKRLCNAQRCIRTGDIESVGDEVHHTFFEMLGNWSLGDYWKKEAISYSFEFLTKTMKIPSEKLSITCFKGEQKQKIPKDSESEKIWKSVGINKIKFLGKEDNWWGPAGTSGPCGPDTEMFYLNSKGKEVEIWNDVFMQYEKTSSGDFLELKQKNVDTGMGVERMLAVLNGLDDNYLTDSFFPIIKNLENISGKKYSDKETKKAMRIITDHLKASVFILADGILPSNTEQGYVLRRLIRRAVRYGKKLGLNHFTERIAKPIFDIYDDYSELQKNKNKILEELKKEEDKFEETLEKGLNVFKKLSSSKKELNGKDTFLLYQSYGFPIELTQELAKENKIKINLKEFEEEFNKHQELSRTASAGRFKSGLADHSIETTKLHTATHILLAALREILKKDSIIQRGSNITPERLRLDFSFPRKLSSEEIKAVEDLVNAKIQESCEIVREEISLESARKRGFMGVFGEKYGNLVSVYNIGNFSKEICTGPHVNNTCELGKFKIIKEESSSSGVRRIKAILE